MVLELSSSARRWASRLAIYGLVLALTSGASAPLWAGEGFRIETTIYQGEEKEPASKATTLFVDGVVYDFLAKPEETAVFRKPIADKPGRFILLNDKLRLQTEVSTDKLAGTMNKLRDWASRQTNPYLQFAAAPKFDETYDRTKGTLVLASKLETYTVKTNPTQHQDALVDYREFLDWYTQLNSLLNTKSPPDPRLQLNDALARHKVVPEKVELKREGQDPIRAEHDFTWRLSQDDLQRVDDVRTALTNYRKVDNEEFVTLGEQAKPVK